MVPAVKVQGEGLLTERTMRCQRCCVFDEVLRVAVLRGEWGVTARGPDRTHTWRVAVDVLRSRRMIPTSSDRAQAGQNFEGNSCSRMRCASQTVSAGLNSR